MLTKEEYRKDPCRAASIPYWKAVSICMPADMIILHEEDLHGDFPEHYRDTRYFRLIHRLQISPATLPEGFSLCKATAEEFAIHIRACYGSSITAAEVRSFTDLKSLRAKALYRQDEGMALRKSHESPIVKELYDTYLGEPGSHKAHELLHCTYVPQKRYRME